MKFPHPGHEKHLCKIWSDTYNVDEVIPNVDEVIPLVKDAKFMCKVCGRAAANQENLCDPTPLE
jgi:DNA replicative helicase MCM subunit Mcm2 (Cdc46/Mcm family)